MFPGASSVRLSIGGLCVAIVSPQPRTLVHLTERYRHFLDGAVAPDFEIEMRSLDAAATAARFLDVPEELLAGLVSEQHHPTRQTPFFGREEMGGRKTKLDSKPEVSRIGDRIVFRRVDFAGCLDLARGVGRVVFADRMQTIAVESFLRIAYSFLAVEHAGLLLHSAAVARGPCGYIFPGPSETGKSTIAGLATVREQVLSDEMVMVRKVSGSYRVYSSPFFGTNASTERNVGVSLRAALLPVKDMQVFLERAAPGRALAKFLASVLFFDRDPAANERLMSLAADVTGTIPFYDMHFRRDGAFWDCIEELEHRELKPC